MTRLECLPAELLPLRQFVAVKVQPSPNRPGKTDKPPINPHTGGLADVTDQTTWASVEEAAARAEQDGLAGVGFVFTDQDPYTGIDLDDCFDADGRPSGLAAECLATIPSYAERSQSGHGLHIIARAKLPPGGRKKTGVGEMYDEGRQFLLTGDVIPGHELIGDCQAEVESWHERIFGKPKPKPTSAAPRQPVNLADADLLAKASGSRDGAEFDSLWRGQVPPGKTHSEADWYLIGKLLFWTGGDVYRADRLFRLSGLFRPGKWDARHYADGRTYGEATLERRLSSMTQLYTPSRNGDQPAEASREAPTTDKSGKQSNPPQPPSEPPEAPITAAGEHLTDLGNARRLVARAGPDVHFCHPWGKWFVWDSMRWALDDTGEVFRRAKATVTAMYAEAAGADDDTRKALGKHALKCESEARIRAMINLAQSEPGIPVLPADLDGNKWLLNTLSGAVDLRTGELRSHGREYLITKLAPVFYEPDATCPQWLAFLDRIMAGNQDLITFLQRAIGYSLTGDTSEQVLFVLHGTGANGKSTLLETIRALLGEEYAVQIRPETLMVKQGDTIPNDVARLKGARLVSARETEEGRRLAEALVKEMTGGDTITARFLRAEFFDFRPEFKLFLAANHRPVIRGTDVAIWRRIRLIPFTVTIPEAEQDKGLLTKLQSELTGILTWAVRGCLDWQRQGLGMPAEVRAATEAYRAESDTLAAFLEECTIRKASAKAQAARLYKAYQSWSAANGEKEMTGTMFGRRLTERGFEKQKAGHVTFYCGLGLIEPEEDSPEEP